MQKYIIISLSPERTFSFRGAVCDFLVKVKHKLGLKSRKAERHLCI